MRVLIVINGLGTGGAQRSLAEMLPGYSERGVDTTVACFRRMAEGVQDAVIADGHDVRFIEYSAVGRIRALRRPPLLGSRATVLHFQSAGQ